MKPSAPPLLIIKRNFFIKTIVLNKMLKNICALKKNLICCKLF